MNIYWHVGKFDSDQKQKRFILRLHALYLYGIAKIAKTSS